MPNLGAVYFIDLIRIFRGFSFRLEITLRMSKNDEFKVQAGEIPICKDSKRKCSTNFTIQKFNTSLSLNQC